MNHLYSIHYRRELLQWSCFWGIVILLSATVSPVLGQNSVTKDKPLRMANIYIKAQTGADSVVLRWAPSTPGGWIIANNLGYMLERVEVVNDNESTNQSFEPLTEVPLKPLPLEEWKSYAGPDNHFSAIAAQAVYGKSFTPEPLKAGELSALKNAADELTNRYSFSLFAADNDAVTANALGLRFVDKGVKSGGVYVYRVFVSQPTTEYIYDTAYVTVTVRETPQWAAPVNLKFESGDGNIKLTWSESRTQPFSGYYVYRSDDNGKTYKKLTEMPLVIVSDDGESEQVPYYIDTLTVNYKKYHYRVLGINPFGGVSAPAEITAFSKDATPPKAPRIEKPQQLSSTKVKVSWKMADAPADLKGFYVSRSAGPVDGFHFLHEKPLAPMVIDFIDEANDGSEPYYCVAAVDTAGNLSFSPTVMAIIIDSIPPSVPENLAGRIDSSGKVTLTWSLGKEKNLIGYRVLRANAPDHEFIQLTGHVHPDTVFIDSVNVTTLTRYVYYKIAAVNNRYQHSELSPMLRLKRPDKVPPTSAVFYDVFVTDSCVTLKWHCSESSDVESQLLFRQREEDHEWKLLKSLKPGVSFYTDKDVLPKVKYYYTIATVDSSGLHSPQAFPVSARPYDTRERKAVENLVATYDESAKAVQVKWNYQPEKEERYWFLIYKSVGNGAYKEYKALASDQLIFVDQFPVNGASGYGVVVKTSGGSESEMAKVVLNIEPK